MKVLFRHLIVLPTPSFISFRFALRTSAPLNMFFRKSPVTRTAEVRERAVIDLHYSVPMSPIPQNILHVCLTRSDPQKKGLIEIKLYGRVMEVRKPTLALGIVQTVCLNPAMSSWGHAAAAKGLRKGAQCSCHENLK